MPCFEATQYSDQLVGKVEIAEIGAGEEIRPLDPLVGNEMLYH